MHEAPAEFFAGYHADGAESFAFYQSHALSLRWDLVSLWRSPIGSCS